MIALAALALGALTSAALWRTMAPDWRETAALQRTNYRGHVLPVAAGAVIVLASVAGAAVYGLAIRWNGVSPEEASRRVPGVLGAVLGFGLLGLLDDLVGATVTKGFRGHLRALARGRVTTGFVKLAFGGLLALAVAPVDAGGLAAMVRAGLVIALAANVANLFDRAPGRVVKVSVAGAVVVALAGAPGWWLTGPMFVVGAGVGMLVPDLRERCMLGDTGANVLGGAVGYGLVLALGGRGEWIAVAVLAAVNAASEVVSFTRVIDATPPLRWLDRAGALPERREHGGGGRGGHGRGGRRA